jgi:hypothetical protein
MLGILRLTVLLLLVPIALLASVAAALTEDPPVESVVRPGSLVLFYVVWSHNQQCRDLFSTVVTEGWYEDAAGD